VSARLPGVIRESVAAFASVFRSRALRRLQFANAASIIGGWAYVVALALYAYEQDGAYAVGLLAAARWVSGGLAAPLAGVIGDRYQRARVMIASDLVRALTLGTMAFAVLAGAPALAVYGLAVVATLSATPFGPAQAALLPQLARSPAELTAANASTSAVDNVGSFLGPSLGGLLVYLADVELVFLVSALLYAGSAVIVASIRHREQREETEPDEDDDGLSALAGFRALVREPRLRLVVGLVTAQTIVDGALDVLIVLLALELLDVGAAGLGFLNSAAGAGGIAAAFVVAGIAARGRLASSLGVGIVLWGLPLCLIGVWPELAVALVLLAVVGAGGTTVAVTSDTLLQRAAPPDVLARVFGAVDSLLLIALAIGSVGVPFLAEAMGVRATLVVVGAFLPVLALLTWQRLAAIDAEAAVPDAGLELLAGSPIFAPLQPPALEALAARLERRIIDAGEVVFAQGDAGDEYYLIEEGRVRVDIDGAAVAEHGPGEGFGEIALLRDVPRTATVTALTDLTVHALEREAFLGAVTGHAQSTIAAEGLVAARLSPAAL
jgi:predicted MFS family arabinose efflux permease